MEMVVGMRNQVLGQLRASGFVRARGQGDIRDINTNSDNWGVVKACLMSGLYPNLGRVDREVQGGHGGPTLRTQRESKVKLHPGSVLGMDRTSRALASLGTDWIMYDEMTRVGRAAYMRGVTPVSPLAVALFAGPTRLAGPSNEAEGVGNVYVEESSDSEEEEGGASQASSLSLDPWTSFRCSQETVTQVSQLRQKWSSLWLRRLAASAKQARGFEEQDDAVVATLAAVLSQEEANLGLAQPQGIGQRPKQLAVDLSTGQPQSGELRRPSDSSDDSSAGSWDPGSRPTRSVDAYQSQNVESHLFQVLHSEAKRRKPGSLGGSNEPRLWSLEFPSPHRAQALRCRSRLQQCHRSLLRLWRWSFPRLCTILWPDYHRGEQKWGESWQIILFALKLAKKSNPGETRLDCCPTCILLQPSDSWSVKHLRRR